jgi:hypothetical protein
MFENRTVIELQREKRQFEATLRSLDGQLIEMTHTWHVLHGDGLSQLENNREYWTSLQDREELLRMNMTRFYVEVRLIREELARRGVASE